MDLFACRRIQFSSSLLSYKLARIGLVRAACPVELESATQNRSIFAPIVVEKNRRNYGVIEATGYSPQAVIIAGDVRRKKLLGMGVHFSWAWIEAGAMQINADDEIGCNELMSKLQELLVERFYGQNRGLANTPGAMWPSILEVYPFENYFVFSMRGQKYRQPFLLDPIERRVRLNGGAQEVKEMFVNAGGSSAEVMPRVQTGVRYATAPMRGNVQTTNTGAANSELITCIVRNWANIREAVDMYLGAIKNGTHTPLRPMFYPVTLTTGNKIADALAAVGVEAIEFAKWSAAQKHKNYQTRDGKKLHKDDFAWAPGDDPSKWKLPLDKPGRVKNALSRINQTQGIPSDSKSGVLSKVRRKAAHIGVGVSDKPTSKQKQWAGKGRSAAAVGV